MILGKLVAIAVKLYMYMYVLVAMNSVQKQRAQRMPLSQFESHRNVQLSSAIFKFVKD